jgi:hypothetical protein
VATVVVGREGAAVEGMRSVEIEVPRWAPCASTTDGLADWGAMPAGADVACTDGLPPAACAVDGRAKVCARVTDCAAGPVAWGTWDGEYPRRVGAGPATPGVADTNACMFPETRAAAGPTRTRSLTLGENTSPRAQYTHRGA